MQINRVYVNSYGALCCAASNAKELFEAICDKKSGIKTNKTFF